MAELDRDFKGVWIPKTVWLDTRLNALEKIILTEIDSLDMSDKGCYASNKYIAEFCQCSETKVSTAISKLVEYGYLYVQSFDGRQRVLKSRLSNFERQDMKSCNSAFENVKESNTYKKTSTKTDNKELYAAILSRLNEKAGTNYKPTSKATQGHINARLSEGYTVEDFFTVIDKKCAEWSGTEMAKYLRPETLFGSKFENYLNAPAAQRRTYGANGIAVQNERSNDLDGVF